jgi:hypothetical protein
VTLFVPPLLLHKEYLANLNNAAYIFRLSDEHGAGKFYMWLHMCDSSHYNSL